MLFGNKEKTTWANLKGDISKGNTGINSKHIGKKNRGRPITWWSDRLERAMKRRNLILDTGQNKK